MLSSARAYEITPLVTQQRTMICSPKGMPTNFTCNGTNTTRSESCPCPWSLAGQHSASPCPSGWLHGTPWKVRARTRHAPSHSYLRDGAHGYAGQHAYEYVKRWLPAMWALVERRFPTWATRMKEVVGETPYGLEGTGWTKVTLSRNNPDQNNWGITGLLAIQLSATKRGGSHVLVCDKLGSAVVIEDSCEAVMGAGEYSHYLHGNLGTHDGDRIIINAYAGLDVLQRSGAAWCSVVEGAKKSFCRRAEDCTPPGPQFSSVHLKQFSGASVP